VTIDGRTERIAHLGRGFTTMVPDYIDVTGQTPLTGCPVWDRNLWLNFRTEPSGQVLVTERASLLRRAARTPTTYPGVYSVDHQGPSILHRGGTVPLGSASSHEPCRHCWLESRGRVVADRSLMDP